MHSKYFNDEILRNLEKRVLSQESFGRFDGYNTGDTYVVFVSENADERLRSEDVKCHLRNLFVNDNVYPKGLTVSHMPTCTRLTEEKIKKIIMGTDVPIENADTAKVKKSVSYRSNIKASDQKLNDRNKETLKSLMKKKTTSQLLQDSIITKNLTAGNPPQVKAKISHMANSYYRKGLSKTVKRGHQHFKPNTICPTRQQEDQAGLPSDIRELEQLLQKLSLFKKKRQLGGSVDLRVNMPLDKQILNVIGELESLIESYKQRPLTLTDLFLRQARLRFRKHILGCAANTWNTLGNVRSLRNICIAVRSCVALLRELFRDTYDPKIISHQYDNEANMSPTLLGPSFDEPLVVIVDRLYYGYLWLFNPKSLENPSSQL